MLCFGRGLFFGEELFALGQFRAAVTVDDAEEDLQVFDGRIWVGPRSVWSMAKRAGGSVARSGSLADRTIDFGLTSVNWRGVGRERGRVIDG